MSIVTLAKFVVLVNAFDCGRNRFAHRFWDEKIGALEVKFGDDFGSDADAGTDALIVIEIVAIAVLDGDTTITDDVNVAVFVAMFEVDGERDGNKIVADDVAPPVIDTNIDIDGSPDLSAIGLVEGIYVFNDEDNDTDELGMFGNGPGGKLSPSVVVFLLGEVDGETTITITTGEISGDLVVIEGSIEVNNDGSFDSEAFAIGVTESSETKFEVVGDVVTEPPFEVLVFGKSDFVGDEDVDVPLAVTDGARVNSAVVEIENNGAVDFDPGSLGCFDTCTIVVSLALGL